MWASSSGLNNIPTTDVVPDKRVVVQTWWNWGRGLHPQQFLGFKASPLEDVEVGVDWKAVDETHGHAMLQAKYAMTLMPDLWKGAIGIANLSPHRSHNGEYFPFVATSLDLKVARLHAGFGAERYNEAFFFGVDRTVEFLDRNLQLKADAIQIDDARDMLFSVGFLYEFGRTGEYERPSGVLGILDDIAKNIVLEGWASIPTNENTETYTLKLNYVVRW